MSTSHPPIVTFYSFKGGAGRTTLMANIAAALAHPEASGLPFTAKKILLWDLDIEAPGLHLLPGLRRDPMPASGFIEWLAKLPTDGGKIGEKNYQAVKKLVYTAPQFANIGILPAFGTKYPPEMYLTDWAYWFHQDAARGADLLRQVAAQFTGYDYVFIDSRTGISDIGGLLTGVLPHLTVLIGQYTRQSTRGLSQAWEALKHAGRNPQILELRQGLPSLELLLVASPVPSDDAALREPARQVWNTTFGREFSDATRQEIPFDGKLLYAERLLATDPADQGALALAYREFAMRVHATLSKQLDQPVASLPGKTGKRDTTAQGKAFGREVAELLGTLGYEVEAEQLVGANRVDLLARRRSGLTDEVFLVECKNTVDMVDKDVVDKLMVWLQAVDAKRLDPRGMLVARSGFTPAALTAAKQYGILAFTPAELERRIYDFAPYLRELCSQWETSDTARYYVEQHLQRQSGETTGLLDAARAWVEGRGERLWVVLGDFGTGKSTFVRRFGYELARRKLDAIGDAQVPVPIVIDLREHPNLTTLEDLVAAHLRLATRDERPPAKAILRMVERGRALLLLDSFDEMGAAAIGSTAEEQFQMLAGITQTAKPAQSLNDEDSVAAKEKGGPERALRRAARPTPADDATPPRARRMLITCRNEFFRTHDEARRAALSAVAPAAHDSLLGQVARKLGAAVEEIPTFTTEQVRAYLQARLGEGAHQAEALIVGNPNMQALAERPVLLEMLVGEYPRLHAEGGLINAARLYAAYTLDWLTRWAARQKTTLQTDAQQRQLLLEALACTQWQGRGESIHYDDLLTWVKQRVFDDPAMKGLDPLRVDLELRTAAFLVRSPDGYYRFTHKSFREYFLARYLLRQAQADAAAFATALELPPLTAPVERFILELLELPETDGLRAALQRGLRHVLAASYCPLASENALRLSAALCRGRDGVIVTPAMRELLQGQPPQLPGAQLAGYDLRGAWLDGADLVGADLEGALLHGAQLGAAHLARARLARADLSDAMLQAAKLEKTDLGDADLRGANLAQASLVGANLRFARLLAARLDEAKLGGADLAYARLAEARLNGVHLDDAQRRLLTAPRALPQAKAIAWPRADDATTKLLARPLPYLLTGHHGAIHSVAFSPDGRFLATASDDNFARLWDAATGQEIRRFAGHGDSVWCVAFSPNGRWLATASGDKSALLWDAATGQEIRRFAGHGKSVQCVAFSPNGRWLATASGDKSTRLWGAATGQEIRRFDGHRDSVLSVTFSPNGRWLATASYDQSARLWDAATGQEIRRFVGHGGFVRCAAFSPDGRLLAIASNDGAAWLWDAAAGEKIRRFAGRGDPVWYVAFSPDGRLLATGGGGDFVRLWDAATGQGIRRFADHDDWVRCVAFSPDGRLLAAVGGYSTCLWDAATGQEIRRFAGHGDPVWCVAFSPDGRLLATASGDNFARLWDATNGQEIRPFAGHDNLVACVAFSPDGRWLATASGDGSARLWDAATGQEIRRFADHGKSVQCVAFSPDGRLLATASDDKFVRLWDAATGQEIHRFAGHGDSVWCVAFSPDGRLLATVGGDKSARLWEVATGQEIRRFTGHGRLVWCVAFSPDGCFLATASNDKSACLWDADTGQEIRHFAGHGDAVRCVVFSPDGRLLATASGDKSARLWDVATGQEIRRFAGHGDRVLSVAFSPDGHLLATASSDKSARLWDVATGELLAELFPSHDGWMCWRHDRNGYYADPAGHGLETFRLINPQDPARLWHPADLREEFDLDRLDRA